MTSKKMLYTLAVLVLLFAGPVGGLPAYGQQDFSVFEERAWKFMTNVLALDLSKYEVVFINRLVPPVELGFQPGIVDLLYRFRTVASPAHESLSVSITFTNGSLTHCNIYFNEPLLLLEKMPEDLSGSLERAKFILEKYRSWFGAKHVEPMLRILDEAKTLGNLTRIEGNIKFMILCETDVDAREIRLVNIHWNHWENGIEFRKKGLGILFTSTGLIFFDTWNIYRIGSAVLKVSMEDAVRIAKEVVKNYTYEAADHEGKTVVVGGFKVLEEPMYVDLVTDYRGKDYYALYPCWEVYLCLDTMYLGGVTAFRVFIWADTGEIAGIYPTGGFVPPAPQTNGEPALNMKTIILLAAIALIAALLTIAIIKTAKKKQTLHS